MIDRLYPGLPGLRRQVRLAAGQHAIRAEVEDDFHNFIVILHHADGIVTQVETAAPRHPWTTCPSAGGLLGDSLTGLRLERVASLEQPLLQCTHMLDLAVVGAAHACDRRPTCFNMFVSDRIDDRRWAELWDGESRLLAWQLLGDEIAEGPAEGQNLRRLREWLPRMPLPLQEPARLLRRAIFISNGRRYDYEDVTTAADMKAQLGACFTYQPERAAQAVPVRGSKLDFTDSPAGEPVTQDVE